MGIDMYLILEYKTAVPAKSLLELCRRKIQNTSNTWKYDFSSLPEEAKEMVEQRVLQEEWRSVWKQKSITNFVAQLIDPDDEEQNPWCAASIGIDRNRALFAVLSQSYYPVSLPTLPHHEGIPEDASALLRQTIQNWNGTNYPYWILASNLLSWDGWQTDIDLDEELSVPLMDQLGWFFQKVESYVDDYASGDANKLRLIYYFN